jgi:transposase
MRSGAEDLFDRHFTDPVTCVANICMDRIEQRVIVKCSLLKGHGRKLIHKELVTALHYKAISLSTIKNWLRRFKSGGLSCSDELKE